MIKTVLFDLDGTLLPMDQDKFVKDYFGRLAETLSAHGYEPQKLYEGTWNGIKAMIKNNTDRPNMELWWDGFTEFFGQKALDDKDILNDFYKNDFGKVQKTCGFNPEAPKTVRKLKENGFRVVLATNPVFPAVATEQRIRWAGLTPEDFELYTTYENSTRCKPNLEYYTEILRKIDCRPEECVMVGNDVSDDMPAENLGMKVFLLTDCLINTKNENISKYAHGTFSDLWEYITTL